MTKSEFNTGLGCIIIGVVVVAAPILWFLSGPILAYYVYKDGWEETSIWGRIFGILAALSVIGSMAYFVVNPSAAQDLEPLNYWMVDVLVLLVHGASLGFIFSQARE